MASRRRAYDEDDDYDDEPRSRSRRRGFECPYCGCHEPPVVRQRISVGGWVVFVIMLLFCFPLFWIGLLMTEDYRVCYECGIKLG